MNFVVNFGYGGTKKLVTNWFQDIKKFPRYLHFENKDWEWVAYDAGANDIDYELHYSEMNQFSMAFVSIDEIINFEERFAGPYSVQCECGAIYDRDFPSFHSPWCPKWRES